MDSFSKPGLHTDLVWVGKPEGETPLEMPSRWWENDIKEILQKSVERIWTGLIWLRIGTDGGNLWMR
jgi:hypothetical protein